MSNYKDYRAILEVPSFTATIALRAEIGASSRRARDAKNKRLYSKHVLNVNRNELVRNILLNQYYDNETQYIKGLKRYMKTIVVKLEALQKATIPKRKEKVNNLDTEWWKKVMTDKRTLRIYSKYKTKIKEISWYDNSYKTNLMIKARTDSLSLNWRNKYKNADTKCLCGTPNEDLEHLILECELYGDIRKKFLFTQQPYRENKEEVISNILLFQELGESEIRERKHLLHELWKERENKIKLVQLS